MTSPSPCAATASPFPANTSTPRTPEPTASASRGESASGGKSAAARARDRRLIRYQKISYPCRTNPPRNHHRSGHPIDTTGSRLYQLSAYDRSHTSYQHGQYVSPIPSDCNLIKASPQLRSRHLFRLRYARHLLLRRRSIKPPQTISRREQTIVASLASNSFPPRTTPRTSLLASPVGSGAAGAGQRTQRGTYSEAQRAPIPRRSR